MLIFFKQVSIINIVENNYARLQCLSNSKQNQVQKWLDLWFTSKRVCMFCLFFFWASVCSV